MTIFSGVLSGGLWGQVNQISPRCSVIVSVRPEGVHQISMEPLVGLNGKTILFCTTAFYYRNLFTRVRTLLCGLTVWFVFSPNLKVPENIFRSGWWCLGRAAGHSQRCLDPRLIQVPSGNQVIKAQVCSTNQCPPSQSPAPQDFHRVRPLLGFLESLVLWKWTKTTEKPGWSYSALILLPSSRNK